MAHCPARALGRRPGAHGGGAITRRPIPANRSAGSSRSRRAARPTSWRGSSDRSSPRAWGQQVIVENRGGAGGTLGAAEAARAPADGYTLLMGAIHHTIATSVYPKLPYDFQKDFAPITVVAIVPNVLVVNPSVPANSTKELIAYAKANPGKLTYGSAGMGTAHHLIGEAVQSAGRGQDPARPLQGQRAGGRGSHRRAGVDHVRHRGLVPPARQVGQAPAARRRYREALFGAARSADHRRSRAAGFRGDDVVRRARSGQDAARRSSPSSTPRW